MIFNHICMNEIIEINNLNPNNSLRLHNEIYQTFTHILIAFEEIILLISKKYIQIRLS